MELYSLRGVKSDQCDVVLKNCPVLEKVQCENHCFEYGRVRIESDLIVVM